ncbi:MAG TPA: amino acid permease [Candidatus Limnocylindrales bacterium]|nr:amino acid permease [Candidatus Limnocylindrales bacterium]
MAGSSSDGSAGPSTIIDDSRKDASADDVSYLRQLGYTQELRRALGLFASFAIQFSLIGISIGLFLLFGYGLTTGGPAYIWPFVIGGALQMVVGLGIAELVSAYPVAGGAYQIVNRITNRVLAWQVGWWLALALLGAVAAEAVGLAPYVGPWFGINNPTYLETLGIGFVTIVITTVICLVGIKIASLVNNIGVVTELFGLSTVLVLLLLHGTTQPLSFLTNTGGTDAGHSLGYLVPFLFVMLMPAFIISSFDCTGHTGEETKNAAVTAPKGVVIANFSCFVYATAAVLILLLSVPDLKGAMAAGAPIVYVVTNRLGAGVANALTVVVVISFLVNMEILELTAARIFWAQARDRQMPASSWLRKISARQTPANATIVAGILAFALCLYSSLLAVLAAVAALLFAASYGTAVAAGILARRRGTLPKHPWHYGRWSQPIAWVGALWSLALCGILIYQNPGQVGLGFIAVIVIGLAVYFIGIPRAMRGVIPSGEVAAVSPRVEEPVLR